MSTFNTNLPQTPPTFFQKLKLTLSMIKFQHSVFALPFALAMVIYASQGRPKFFDLLLIGLCMVTARNAAMSFNRIVDWKLDAQNPRTQNREIPSGRLSLKFSVGFCTFNALLFILLSSFFNILTLILSPIALIIILGYSLTKRFTHATQFFLGFSLGIAPIAAWIAVTGTFALFPVGIGLGVFFWVAGFDLIYSTLDYDYDTSKNLKNLVVKLGIKRALILSRILHALTLITFVASGIWAHLPIAYFVGLGVMAALLIYEHTLVRHDDLSRVNVAFFTFNGYVSLVFLLTAIVVVW